MNFPKILVPVGCLVLMAAAFSAYGWRGIAVVGGGIVMWLLLHFTLMMTVLKRAAERPVGYVASAVMLNARLKTKVNLLHVLAMTRALGLRLSEEGADPEVFRWTDASDSYVDCTFERGKLVRWQLTRPPVAPEAGPAALPGDAPATAP